MESMDTGDWVLQLAKYGTLQPLIHSIPLALYPKRNVCLPRQLFAQIQIQKKGSYYDWLEKYLFAQIQIQNTKKYICWPKQELWSMEKQLITTPPHAADNELNFCSMFCHSAVLPMIYAQRSNWGQLYWSGIVPRLKRWQIWIKKSCNLRKIKHLPPPLFLSEWLQKWNKRRNISILRKLLLRFMM